MDALRLLAPVFMLGIAVGFVLSGRLNRSFWYEADRIAARIERLEKVAREAAGERRTG